MHSTQFDQFLGGDAKLLVMLCVSPAQRFITETLHCLGFGSRARQVARGQVKKRRGTCANLSQSLGKGSGVLNFLMAEYNNLSAGRQ